MKECYGQHGWREFHQNRKNILTEFDKIIEQISNRPVKTAHGNGVEAYIRKWLSEFLPKKYGVTSGYIISGLYGSTNIYHFDIIVYNCLDAPVLWTEGNEDNNEQGKYRAIPAQHVVAVYEVKSKISVKSVRDALSKLTQINEFSDQLSKNYSCGMIFIDLKNSENNSHSILRELHKGKDIFGFKGGVILRYENDDQITGVISIFNANDINSNNHIGPLARPIDDLKIYRNEDGNVQIAEQGAGIILVVTAENTWSVSKMYSSEYVNDGILLCLSWSRSNFSRFCVDFLGVLDGMPYNDQRRQSFGMIFDSLRLEKAPLQSMTPEPDYPFLSVSLHSGGVNGEKLLIRHEKDSAIIEYWIKVTNEGAVDAEISDNRFKDKIVLPPGKICIRKEILSLTSNDPNKNMRDILSGDGLNFKYRLIYKFGKEEKKIFAIEKEIKISDGNIYMIDLGC